MGTCVTIVDDDEAVRDSLTLLLQTNRFDVAVFKSGDDLLKSDLFKITGPILLDVRMPGRDGLETLTQSLEVNPKLHIIMMSGHADVEMAVKALRCGAKDFIEKPFHMAHILSSLARVNTTVTQNLQRNVLKAKGEERLATLTPREREVMAYLVEGKPNKIIAAKLGLSVRTIETHRAHLISKLNVKSLPELVRLSMQTI
ncbi:response regulator transcription factor [Robiginitomaculum antarcticum]|uniref:response regulator transcription factor n=1 Tax=Robiginitomaculum antarcticum TaxID=437507 RepID=UPI0003806F97|nr:response regulator [Robiginitomaculum antarcticum]